MQPTQQWTNRVSDRPPERQFKQSFQKPHSTLGSTGHWVRQAGILAPLIIGEFVPDADKRWRYTRIASVATALISEGLYTARVHHQREETKTRLEQHYQS